MSDFQQRLQVELPSASKIFTPVVTTFLILYVAGYAMMAHLGEFTVNFLALSPPGVFSGKVWQLVTYSFINGCTRGLIFDGLVLLFFGSMLERHWKSGPLVMLWLVSTVICGIVWVVVSFIFRMGFTGVGSGPFSYAIIAAFGIQFRKQKMFAYFWTLEAQFVALLLIIAGLVLNIAQPIYWIFVGGAAVGYFFVKFREKNPFFRSGRRQVKEHSVRSSGFVDLD